MEHHNEQTHHEESNHSATKMNSRNHWIIGGVVGLLILIIVGGLAWLYTGKVAGAKEKIFKALPLPAAIVDMKFVSAKESLARIELANKLSETQGLEGGAVATEIYDQLIETRKLSAVADRYKVSVSSESVDEEYNNIVKQYAQGDAEKFKTEM